MSAKEVDTPHSGGGSTAVEATARLCAPFDGSDPAQGRRSVTIRALDPHEARHGPLHSGLRRGDQCRQLLHKTACWQQTVRNTNPCQSEQLASIRPVPPGRSRHTARRGACQGGTLAVEHSLRGHCPQQGRLA
eukprot:6241343-Prymnesium_polylepis.5